MREYPPDTHVCNIVKTLECLSIIKCAGFKPVNTQRFVNVCSFKYVYGYTT